MKYAINPTAGDPYIFRYWLRFYDREVANRIDKLYVGQHGPADPKSIEIIKDLCDARNIKFNPCSDLPFAHDASLEKAYSMIENRGKEEDYIMMFQTDCFTFNGKILDKYFQLLDSGTYRMIGERKGGYTIYWPGEPHRKDVREVTQLWPCWLFSHASDFHKAYETVIQDAIDTGTPLTFKGTSVPFSGYKGNEEWVTMAHILETLVPKDKFLLLNQERAHHGTVINADKRFDWFHFGCLEQQPLQEGLYRDNNDISVIYSPNAIEFHNNSLIESHTCAYNLTAVVPGMYKAMVISGDDHPYLREGQKRRLDSIENAIVKLFINRELTEKYCEMFLGWIK